MSKANPTSDISLEAKVNPASVCPSSALANRVPGEVRCPICFHIVPPEHMGYKLRCRRCGYLESCCNPL